MKKLKILPLLIMMFAVLISCSSNSETTSTPDNTKSNENVKTDDNSIAFNGEKYVMTDIYGSVNSNWSPIGELSETTIEAASAIDNGSYYYYDNDKNYTFILDKKNQILYHKDSIKIPAAVNFDSVEKVVLIDENNKEYECNNEVVLALAEKSYNSKEVINNNNAKSNQTLCIKYKDIPAYLNYADLSFNKDGSVYMMNYLSEKQGSIILSPEEINSITTDCK